MSIDMGQGRKGKGGPTRIMLVVRHLPKGVGRRQYLQGLLESIEDGSYQLPSGWDVRIRWSNGPRLPWHEGPWELVMDESAGRGDWERLVRNYVSRLLAQYEDEVREALHTLDLRRDRSMRSVIERNRKGEISDTQSTIERARILQEYRRLRARLDEL